jgi:surface antigen
MTVKSIFKTDLGKPAAAALVTALVVGLASPASAQMMGPREEGGTAAGALIGGALGGALGGRNPVAGAIVGAAVGSFVGNRIGAALDEADRQALSSATRAAVVSGKPKRFSRKGGARGKVDVVRTSQSNGRQCRTLRQEVVLKDGRVLNDTVNACKGPRGWEV